MGWLISAVCVLVAFWVVPSPYVYKFVHLCCSADWLGECGFSFCLGVLNVFLRCLLLLWLELCLWACTMAVRELACIARFFIMLYVFSVGRVAFSGRFVSCSKRMSARCLLIYMASWFCFSNPLIPRTLRVSILITMVTCR